MKIPVPYQLILKRMNGIYPDEIIGVKEFRRRMVRAFRCSREYVNKMLIEMKEMGLIKYEGCKLIRIIKKIN